MSILEMEPQTVESPAIINEKLQADIEIEKVRADNDSAWKEILHSQLKDFIEFFWLEAYQDIDWGRPYESLDQELMAIMPTDDNGKGVVDKLFKVYLKNGEAQWILLHVDVQHSKQKDFEERMFIYYYRIFERYNKQDVASMAVLVDKNKSWRPTQFHRNIWGSSITRTFKTVKLIDYKSKITELENSDNPFALIILLQLTALKTRADEESRLMSKLEFFRVLGGYGWTPQKIWDVYRFLDIILTLNKKFEIQYVKSVREMNEEQGMNIRTSIERYAYQEGGAEILTNLLKVKFREVPEKYLNEIKEADPITLNKWSTNFVFANSLEDVFNNQ